MWVVHRALRFGYSLGYRAGLLSSPLGRSLYERAYERFKLRTELDTIRLLCRDIVPGSLAIDVGANIGIYTAAFVDHVGSAGHVIAIEPDPSNARSLRRRFAANAAVNVVEAAAADTTGMLHLNQDPYNPAGHVLADEGLTIRSVTVDELVARGDAPVSVMKIDVEGAEPLVLKGAAQTLRTHRPTLLLEYAPERIASFVTDPRTVLADLADLGYEFRLSANPSALSISDVEIACRAKGYVDLLVRHVRRDMVQRAG